MQLHDGPGIKAPLLDIQRSVHRNKNNGNRILCFGTHQGVIRLESNEPLQTPILQVIYDVHSEAMNLFDVAPFADDEALPLADINNGERLPRKAYATCEATKGT